MPYKEPKVEQFQYSIGEVAEMFGENISTIRYWSDEFEGTIKPARNNKGNRIFSHKDLDIFKIIYHLVRECGVSLGSVKKRIAENRDGEYLNAEIVNRLETVRTKLLEIKKMI
ncbi:MAG: MerR family transcriptional regulator [Prevotellaceae bacterium]|jgi:DNA-binding transcriptional MerR regulator|nr:MerR family transcriptional regulator [Prevotellaceae bacterium]